MLTAAQLNALPYTTTPEVVGHTIEVWRRQYRAYGEPCRVWLPGQDVDGNVTLSELELAATTRVMRYNTTENYTDVQGNLIQVGATALSVLPDEIELREGAYIVFTHNRRAVYRRIPDFTRRAADGFTDTLPYRPVANVIRVRYNGSTLINGTDYRQHNDGITWLTGSVPIGAKCSIEWRAYPGYRVTTEVRRDSPIGADGELLPTRWILNEEKFPSYL